jgi:natural product biosynthesis luciferase-like monooxygenase protein
LESVRTLVNLLRYRAIHQPNRVAYTFLEDGITEAARLTYQELDLQARAIATQLQSLQATGERALLLYPPSLDFIAAFFGCLYAGVISIPVYPPRSNQNLVRLQSVVKDAQANFALTNNSLLTKIKQQLVDNLNLEIQNCIATDNIGEELADSWQNPEINEDTLAFIQYTSGSTGTPKGVMLNHSNLMHNQRMIEIGFGHTEKTIFVGWLPLFHDMGLIGNVLQPLYLGIPSILMSPVAFLQNPCHWLQAISHYKATTSGGPNFAYDLCVRKVTPEQRRGLDLSSWEVAFNGAEPIRAETLERFITTFEPCGFRKEAFYPCYGMAEASLFVSGGIKTNIPVVAQVEAAALQQNKVVAAANYYKDAQKIVGCGKTWLEQKIKIVNPKLLTECLPDQVGEIWVSSPSVAKGYWNQPEQTKQTFCAYLADNDEGPFLRTGDLGFMQEGELFVTGRLKDTIIIRGCNHYPQDIELTVEQSHPAIRNPNCTAAFSVDVEGEERLVVVAEVGRRYMERRRRSELPAGTGAQRRQLSACRQTELEPGSEPVVRKPLDVAAVSATIRQAVAQQHDLQVYAVLFLKPGSIFKTSSGKLQRHACRESFLAGTLEVINSSVLDLKLQSSASQTATSATAVTSESSRQLLLELDLRNQISQILRISPEVLTASDALNSLGLDSLKVVEIKNYIEINYGLTLPVEIFLEEIGIRQIASWILSGSKSPVAIAQSTPKMPMETFIKPIEEVRRADGTAEDKKAVASSKMDFSLFYFSSNEAEFAEDKYRLLIEGAKFADQHNFTAVWIPERHFHAFGGLYPNPSVLAAALAMVTQRVRIRAGSVVLPMHNPVRVAEEWSAIDNLSQGRVDIGFAAGWNPNDFVFAPANYANRTEVLFTSVQTVQKLWRGESISLPNGVGEPVNIKIYPLPKQRELSVWTTCTGGKERFMQAGAAGTNILTALLFQSVEELAEKIAIYREARAKNGHDPDSGHVTLMLHTFIGENLETVRTIVRQPFIEYLKSSVNLWRQGAESLDDLSEKEQQELLAYAFERYFQTSALFGTPASCLEKVERLKEIGVNEIASLIDFGVDRDSVMASLYSLKKLKNLVNENSKVQEKSTQLLSVSRHDENVISHLERALLSDALQKDSSLPTKEIGIYNKAYLDVAISGSEIRRSLASRTAKITTANYAITSNSFDLNSEAVLEDTIRPSTTNAAIPTEPAHVFLTGATGYLGAFLLFELLQQTQADIYCLVRASSTQIGLQRIQKNLENYSLWNDNLKKPYNCGYRRYFSTSVRLKL